MRSLGKVWRRFWFRPVPATTVVAMRVLLGFATLGWALSITLDLRTFYFDDGLLPTPNYADYRLGLFQWLTGDVTVVIVWGSMVLGAISLIAGRRVRIGAPLLWIATLTLQQGAPNALNAGDILLRVWTSYFALFAVLTPRQLVDVPLFGLRGPTGTREWPIVSSWIVRLVQIQLTVIYPATVIAKLDGETWRRGTAALYALELQDFERFWLPDFVRQNLAVGNLLTWVTLGIEFSLPFLLWTRRTRWLGIVAGLAMHAGFDYTMRLGFFFPAMAIGYLAFIRPSEMERTLDVVRSLPVRLKRVIRRSRPAIVET